MYSYYLFDAFDSRLVWLFAINRTTIPRIYVANKVPAGTPDR